MPLTDGIHMFAVLAVGALAVTGCGPESGAAPSATATLAVDARAKQGTAESADCHRAVVPWSGLKWFATATPADLRHCSTVEGTDRPEFLDKAASPVFRDDENASGVRALLATGIDPDHGNRGSATPLSFRANGRWIRRSFPYTLRSPEADEAVVRALLEAGAYPNAIFSGHGSVAKPILPLLRAARRNNPSAIPVKVSVAADGQGWRVLHAAIAADCATSTIAALLEHGADPNLTVAGGQDWTAFHVAAFMSRPDVIRLLLAHGANPHAATTSRKRTALHALAEGDAGPGAAESGHLLLDAGIDPILRDRKGRTPWDLVRARLKPERLAIAEPVVRTALARLQTATGG